MLLSALCYSPPCVTLRYAVFSATRYSPLRSILRYAVFCAMRYSFDIFSHFYDFSSFLAFLVIFVIFNHFSSISSFSTHFSAFFGIFHMMVHDSLYTLRYIPPCVTVLPAHRGGPAPPNPPGFHKSHPCVTFRLVSHSALCCIPPCVAFRLVSHSAIC